MYRCAVIGTTVQAAKCLLPLCAPLPADLWMPSKLRPQVEAIALPIGQAKNCRFYEGALADVLADLWPAQGQFVFAMATGAVVRLIAPLLHHKSTDPAVVVVNPAGTAVISLCGGHQAGADGLTYRVARLLGAEPIITSASQGLGLSGIDLLGQPFSWQKGSGDWTGVSAAIARQAPVQIIQECGTTLWQAALPANHPFQFGWPELARDPETPKVKARVWISPIQRRFAPDAAMPKVQWHPRVLWVGLGCERGTSQGLMDWAIEQAFRQHHLALGAIAGIASLDLKKDEPGLLNLCRDRQWPLRCFSAGRLQPIPVPNPSETVAAAVGTPSVAEAAALLAAYRPILPLESASSDQALTPIELEQLAQTANLRAGKQVFRRAEDPGAVTVAVAQAEQEYIDRPGQLLLVGTGPGDLNQMTAAAKDAIARAQVIIGYGLYLNLISPLLQPGQITEAFPITQEQQRAERAIELAQWGLSVAVISSGDAGIYGMAGLVMETLQQRGWNGKTPTVQVLPGITALQAAAAQVGTPLMHDFCAISLSDLLTPWEVIEQRLQAAAQADFVIALYNPKSKTRTQPFADACRILRQYRAETTPVAIVRSAYRVDQSVTLTTLAELNSHPIDMVTTLLIGNKSSLKHYNWMITPRGYLGFGK